MKYKLRVLLLCIGLAVVSGCGYGEVSPTAYELSMSLYNVSNRKLDEQLPAIVERVTLAKTDGDISEREAKWLDDIVELAKEQDWKTAMQRSRRIMEDQVSD